MRAFFLCYPVYANDRSRSVRVGAASCRTLFKVSIDCLLMWAWVRARVESICGLGGGGG